MAQKTIITGRVYDAVTRQPMPFVNLQLRNTTVGTTTDIDGNYKLETTTVSDSIQVSYIGYFTSSKPILNRKEQLLDFFLQPEAANLGEVTVHPGENPAWRIMREVIDHRDENDPSYLDAYQYDSYNKVEFDMNNIPKSYEDKKVLKPVKFVFNYIDSTNVQEKPYLPVFISESTSEFYYRNSPRAKKEVIKATQFSGFKSQSVAQFTGEMYQNVDMYASTFLLFGQEFNSPLSSSWKVFYKYYLIDSSFLNGHWCYQIQFKPKHKQEFAFTGNMWISDTTFALARLEMTIPHDVNLNFVQGFSVIQEYSKIENKYWMLSKNKLIIDFALAKKTLGVYGRKTTLYSNFRINKPQNQKFYSFTNNLIVEDSAGERSKAYWDTIRKEPLSREEKNIYKMVDTIQTLPIYNLSYKIATTILTSYTRVGNFEIGPEGNFYSYNTVEGSRIRFGGRTSDKFSNWYELSAYGAYGFKDNKMKYSLGFKTFITRKPWQQLELHYSNDYIILGSTDNLFGSDNILTSILARTPLSNLTALQETKFTYDRDIFTGLEVKLSVFDRIFSPLQNAQYLYYGENGTIQNKLYINNPGFQLYLNFAYNDKYIESTMSRMDVGTRYPTLQLLYTVGFKGIFNGDYQYHRIDIGLSEVVHINPFGDTHYIIAGGKIWGIVPYPLMTLHPGNETYIYDPTAYNLMNYYEFGSDQFVSLRVEHHFEGFFFSKIPLFRKLKWREIAGAKFLVGRINEQNIQTLILPSNLASLNNGPYSEADLGIENILKVIRIDAVWRLSYLNNPNVTRFGIMGTLQLIF